MDERFCFIGLLRALLGPLGIFNSFGISSRLWKGALALKTGVAACWGGDAITASLDPLPLRFSIGHKLQRFCGF